jgi:ACR3 family arsenite efflux pump ArsB
VNPQTARARLFLTRSWITTELAKEYTAGLIILAAAPCKAMVLVWSYPLTVTRFTGWFKWR